MKLDLEPHLNIIWKNIFCFIDPEELWGQFGILEIFVFARKTFLINLTHSSLSSDRSWQYSIFENLRKLIVISFANIICSQWAQCIFTTQFHFPLLLQIHKKHEIIGILLGEISGSTISGLIGIWYNLIGHSYEHSKMRCQLKKSNITTSHYWNKGGWKTFMGLNILFSFSNHSTKA